MDIDPLEFVESADEQAETKAAAEKAKSSLNTLIAITVALLATFLAICSVKDNNIGQAIQQAQAGGSRCRHLKHDRTTAGRVRSDSAIEAIKAFGLITKSITFSCHQLEEGGLVHNSFITGILNGQVQIDQSGICARSFLLAGTVNDQSTIAQYNLLTTGLATRHRCRTGNNQWSFAWRTSGGFRSNQLRCDSCGSSC